MPRSFEKKKRDKCVAYQALISIDITLVLGQIYLGKKFLGDLTLNQTHIWAGYRELLI